MSRMFTPEPSFEGAPSAVIREGEPEAPVPGEFEFVLGRRQVASVSLLGCAVVAILVTGAYIVGKSSVPAVATPPSPVANRIVPAAKPIEIVVPTARPVVPPEPPLFGVPERDRLYIQLGSVERGFAVLMVHGARKAGYPAFVGTGTNPNVFRVLVGPFEDKLQYDAAKGIFQSMGLDTFSRKYSEPPQTQAAE